MCSLAELTKLSKTNTKVRSTTTTKTKTISKTLSLSSISVPDKCDVPIFKFRGFCLSGADISGKLKSFLPSSLPQLEANWDRLVAPIIAKIPMNPTGCIGDFDGKQISETIGSQNMNCDSFPLNKDTKVSMVGFAVENVLCGKPISVKMCVIFDKCGTFGISMNAGLGVCVAAASTGVGAILSVVSDVLNFVQIGFSPNRKFEQTLQFLELKDGKMNVKEVVIKSHLYFGVGITMPQTQIMIKGKDFSEYVTFSATAKTAIDFGHKPEMQLDSMIADVKKGDAKQAVKEFFLLAREMSVAFTGSITIALNDLTYGLIPDLSLSDISLNYLITQGVHKRTGNAGNSGLSAGFYCLFKPNIIKTIYRWVKTLIQNLAAPLLALGLKIPELPEDINIDDIELGLTVTQGQIGIKFKNPLFDAYCIFVYSGDQKGGCDFTSKIGALILKEIINFAAKGKEWIISAGHKLLETKTGQVFLKVAMDAKNFAKNAKNEAEKQLKKAGRVLTTVVNDIGKPISYSVKVVNKELDKAAKAVENEFNKAGMAIGNELNKAGAAVGHELNKAANALGINQAGAAVGHELNKAGAAVGHELNKAGNEINQAGAAVGHELNKVTNWLCFWC